MRSPEIKSYSVCLLYSCVPITSTNCLCRIPSLLGSRESYHRSVDSLHADITARLDGYGVGVVLRSELKDVKSGDHLWGVIRQSYLFSVF